MKRVLVVVVAVLVAAIARAQDVQAWTERGSAALGGPGALIVVDSLGRQLATAGGAQTVALVLGADPFDAGGLAAGSWSQLSRALDAEPMEAFNRLFGSRVALAFSSLGVPMSSEWVVATAVSRDDASRVLKGLGAVQRGVLAGATVFSIERGAFQLCVLKQAGGGRVLVLGPGAGVSAGVFRDAVRGLQDDAGAQWFASDWPIDEDGGLLLLVGNGDTGPTLAHAHATDLGWSGVALTPSTLPADTPTWSLDARSMLSGASLGMIGSLDAASLAGSPLAPFLGVNRATAESVLGRASRRGVVCVTADDQGTADVVLALETEPDRAVEIDAAMRMLIAVVTGRPSDAPNFDGRFPEAMRSAPLSGGFSERIGQLVLGEEPSVRWQMRTPEHGTGLLAVATGPPAGTRKWPARAPLEAMTGLERVDPGPLVSAGRIEPGPIAGIIERAAGLERPVLEWARSIESITWQTRLKGADRVKAEFEIVLRGD